MNKRKLLALLLALALSLGLLSACGEKDTPDPAPAPGETEEKEPPRQPEGEGKIEGNHDQESLGDDTEETEPPAGEGVEVPQEEPAPEPPEPEEQEPVQEPETEPEPEPEPKPEETVPEDGTYTAAVTLGGGTGRATVESPAVLRCESGQFWATIVWSSANYDYMKVDGQRYDPINTEGNSTFEIPVSAFDQPLAVIADTVAMSEPHEIEYTLTFDSASMQGA